MNREIASVTATATSASLQPANNRMVAVTIRGIVVDIVPGSGIERSSARFAVTDTYGQVQPNGSIAVGTGGSYSVTLLLLAWTNVDDFRDRIYTVAISVRDLAGNLGVGTTVVRVPHDQRQ